MLIKPDRTIDALVAEHFFGWKWTPNKEHSYMNWTVCEGIWSSDVPDYTSNIAEAMKVIERIIEMYGIVRIECRKGAVDGHLVEITWSSSEKTKRHALYRDESLPLAICKAALDAANIYREPKHDA